MLAQSYPIISGAVTVLKDISSDEALRVRAEREMLARLDQIDWEATIREEALEEGRKEMALLMREDGEPEEKVKRYTGYTFEELDTLK